jgi:copper chaperone
MHLTNVASDGSGKAQNTSALNSKDRMMRQSFQISGMHCNGCVARVTKALKPLADDVTVTLDPPRATIETSTALSIDAVRAALAKAGDYQASAVT